MINTNKWNIILGSQSPRRKQLLEQLGYSFSQIAKETDERFHEEMDITDVAEFLSRKKAKAYENDLTSGQLLITSDTTVCIGEKILNKPKNEAQAKEMLMMLSGKKHQVISGVCLSSTEKTVSFSVSTTVSMKELSPEEINYYIEKFQPFDKAGAYGIQEWIGLIGVEKIEGSFYNVMGLPVKALYEAIEAF